MNVEPPDPRFMELALKQAELALSAGEVPVGAVIVQDGRVLSAAHNRREELHDPTAHAEIMAIREASRKTGNYRLGATTLYCTIEPCTMCAGAILHSRIRRLVFGAPDIRFGAAGSLYNLLTDPRFNHSVEVIRGIRDVECTAILQNFFRPRRV